jgi:nonsense-mediated mRNA decay protein 3
VDGEFCIVCGRTDRPLDDGLCAECFAKRFPLIETVGGPQVTLCPSCGSRQVRDRWELSKAGKFLGAEDLHPFLRPHPDVGIRRVSWNEVGVEANARAYDGVATVRFRGLELEVPLHLKVRVEAKSCPACSRKAGHFYTAQIQLRGPDERLPPGARKLRDRLRTSWEAVLPDAKAEWRRSLSWAEERPEGWDFFLTDTLAARGIAKLLKVRAGAQLKESATLWGRKDGRDVYRVTICVRLPLTAMPPADEELEGRDAPRAHVER